MRSAVACFLAGLLIVGDGRAASADPQAVDRDVTIGNHSPQAINEIYVSPSSADHWGEDRLGDETLQPGGAVKVKLGRARDCEFDVQVVYDNASREEAKGVDVCRNHVLTFDGTGATAPIPSAEHEVTIANRAGRPIQQVLISPSDAGDWGKDRLGNASISVGETATFHYRGDCVADVRVIFDNLGAEERRGVDLCGSHRIAIEPGWTTADTVPTEAQPGGESMQLIVANHSGRKVANLFVFPDNAKTRGPDLLGSDGLADGGSVTIAFTRPPEVCRFDASVVFAAAPAGPGQEARMDGIDLCHAQELVLPATL
jgi:hypothetical protein